MKLVICKKAPHKDKIMDDRQLGHPFIIQINMLRVLLARGKDVQAELTALEAESDRLTIQNIINQINGSVGWQGHYDYSTDPNDYEVIEVKDITEVKAILKDKKEITHKSKKLNKWTETHPDLTAQREAEKQAKKDKKIALQQRLGITDEDLEILKGDL